MGAALELNVVVMTLFEYTVTVDGGAELTKVVTEVTIKGVSGRGSSSCFTTKRQGPEADDRLDQDVSS